MQARRSLSASRASHVTRWRAWCSAAAAAAAINVRIEAQPMQQRITALHSTAKRAVAPHRRLSLTRQEHAIISAPVYMHLAPMSEGQP